MYHAGDASNATSVRSGNTTGIVGVDTENGDDFAQCEHKHTRKQNSNCGVPGEKGDSGHIQQKSKNRFGNLRDPLQQDGQNRCKGDYHKSVQRIQVAIDGGAGFTHGILQLQREQDANQIGWHGCDTADQQHTDQDGPLPENLQHRNLFVYREFIFAVGFLQKVCVLGNRVFGMDKEKDQNGRYKNRKTVDAECQSEMMFKEKSGKTGTHDKAKVKTQIGQGVCLFTLLGGGIVRVQSVIRGRFNGLEQTGQEQDNGGSDGQRKYCRQQIQTYCNAVKDNNDGFAAEAVSQLSAQQSRGKRKDRRSGNYQGGHAIGQTQLGGQKEGEHGPDKRTHGSDQLAYKENVDFPFQSTVLGEQLFHKNTSGKNEHFGCSIRTLSQYSTAPSRKQQQEGTVCALQLNLRNACFLPNII